MRQHFHVSFRPDARRYNPRILRVFPAIVPAGRLAPVRVLALEAPRCLPNGEWEAQQVLLTLANVGDR